MGLVFSCLVLGCWFLLVVVGYGWSCCCYEWCVVVLVGVGCVGIGCYSFGGRFGCLGCRLVRFCWYWLGWLVVGCVVGGFSCYWLGWWLDVCLGCVWSGGWDFLGRCWCIWVWFFCVVVLGVGCYVRLVCGWVVGWGVYWSLGCGWLVVFIVFLGCGLCCLGVVGVVDLGCVVVLLNSFCCGGW